MNKTLSLVLLFLINVLCPASFALEIPAFQGDVLDETNTLTQSEQDSLKLTIKRLREDDDVWMAIYVAKNLQSTNIEDLAQKTFLKWKLGEKGKDNGLLFIFVPSERRMRLEVGYGLEPIFTDVWSVGLLDQVIRPKFKEKNYILGIQLAIDKISQQKRLSNYFPIIAEAKASLSPENMAVIEMAMTLFLITNVLFLIGYIMRKVTGLLEKSREYSFGTALATLFLSFFLSFFIQMGLNSSNKKTLYISGGFALVMLIVPALLYFLSSIITIPIIKNALFSMKVKFKKWIFNLSVAEGKVLFKILKALISTLFASFFIVLIFDSIWVPIIVLPIYFLLDYLGIIGLGGGRSGGSGGRGSSGGGSSSSSSSGGGRSGSW